MVNEYNHFLKTFSISFDSLFSHPMPNMLTVVNYNSPSTQFCTQRAEDAIVKPTSMFTALFLSKLTLKLVSC